MRTWVLLKCFIRLVEGQGIHYLNCPVCAQPFKQEQVSSYRTVVSLREKLVVACTRCDKKYSARQKIEYTEHVSKCKVEPFKLMDILSIPSVKRMPYGAEKVASHVVRLKMAESNTPNKTIQLPSGSSRVRIFYFANYNDMLYLYYLVKLEYLMFRELTFANSFFQSA